MKRLLGLLIASILTFSYFTSTTYAAPSEQSTANYLMEYAGRFMERRTQPLVDESAWVIVPLTVDSTNSVSRFLNEGAIRESQAIYYIEAIAAEELDKWRDYFVKQWGGYSHFDIELTLLNYEVSADNAVLTVLEFTKLFFAEQQLRDAMEHTGWQYKHNFVFERDSSDWVLVSQEVITNKPMRPLTEPGVAPPE